MSEHYLDHFIEAHKCQFNSALKELLDGRKRTHWIWFIFPIAPGLAKSSVSRYYELSNLAEAKAFIEHAYLGKNYNQCLKAILKHKYKKAEKIFGQDKWKFQASITIFSQVASDPSIKKNLKDCLEHFFKGHLCKSTSKYLESIDN